VSAAAAPAAPRFLPVRTTGALAPIALAGHLPRPFAPAA
jgi:hypothetical protein